jgi:signal peptidase I
MSLRISTILVTIGVIAVAALGWLFLGPTQLGGSAAYVITKGISMEPRIHGGDLVILRKHSSYRVGDVVGYRDAQLHRIVLHRIIGIQGDLLTMKGDNNNFVDPERPTMGQVVGEKWIRIPHGGSVLIWVQRPTNAGMLALGAMILAAAGTQTRRRKRPKGGPASVAPKAPRQLSWVWVAPTALLVLSGALAIAAFGRSTASSVSIPDLYRVSGDFSYSGKAQPSLAYPTGAVGTSQTAFTNLVGSIKMRFRYRVEAVAPAFLKGHASMTMRLAAKDTKWSRTYVLSPRQVFRGSSVTLTGSIPIRQLGAVVEAMQPLTGINTTSYELSVLPSVEMSGIVGAQAVKDTLTPRLDFVFDGHMLAVDTAALATPDTNPMHVSKTVPGLRNQKTSIDLRFATLGIHDARMLSLVGLLLAALGFVGVFTYKLRRRHLDEPRLISRLYSHLLLPVANLPQLDRVVEVDDMDALANVADRYDRPILHYEDGDRHVYLLQDEGLVYRYIAMDGLLATPNGHAQQPAAAAAPAPAAAPHAPVASAPPPRPASWPQGSPPPNGTPAPKQP